MMTRIRLTVDEIKSIRLGQLPIPKGTQAVVPSWNLHEYYPDETFQYGELATVMSEPELPIPEKIMVLVDGKDEPIMVYVRGLLF